MKANGFSGWSMIYLVQKYGKARPSMNIWNFKCLRITVRFFLHLLSYPRQIRINRLTRWYNFVSILLDNFAGKHTYTFAIFKQHQGKLKDFIPPRMKRYVNIGHLSITTLLALNSKSQLIVVNLQNG